MNFICSPSLFTLIRVCYEFRAGYDEQLLFRNFRFVREKLGDNDFGSN